MNLVKAIGQLLTEIAKTSDTVVYEAMLLEKEQGSEEHGHVYKRFSDILDAWTVIGKHISNPDGTLVVSRDSLALLNLEILCYFSNIKTCVEGAMPASTFKVEANRIMNVILDIRDDCVSSEAVSIKYN